MMRLKFTNSIILLSVMLTTLLLSACEVGPDYVRPVVKAPSKYKEASKNWKVAQPRDIYDRGDWWKMFHDPQLNKLESQLNITNQTIAASAAQYQQARALVDEALSNYYPTVTGSANLTRQKQGSSGSGTFVTSATSTSTSTSSSSSTSSSGGAAGAPTAGGTGGFSTGTGGNPSTNHSLFLDATWEPDLWGAVRRQVEASAYNAQSSAALLASVRLASQASLAQDYFTLRALDNDQKIFNDTVKDDKKALTITQNQYKSGVSARTAVIQAQTQLETAQATAINNGITRAQMEHAIAVLINLPPANFKLAAVPCAQRPPEVPLEFPSQLLERRPDVAQQERLVAQANAQIGVAVSAFYPTLNLSATGNVTNPGYANWFSLPALSWALGTQVADTLFDGGLRKAAVAAAQANYYSTVATYRQTVLTAFQNVEDSLASLRILNRETKVLDQAAKDARWALKLIFNDYLSGTVVYTDVITAQNTALAAEQAASDAHGQQMLSAVLLIKALGGGWEVSSIENAAG